MELWIRSQDKEYLLKVESLYINKSLKGYTIMEAFITLGTYGSKERALEVLDEIQKIIGWIQKDMKYTTIGDVNHLIGCYDNYVYEMPKE